MTKTSMKHLELNKFGILRNLVRSVSALFSLFRKTLRNPSSPTLHLSLDGVGTLKIFSGLLTITLILFSTSHGYGNVSFDLVNMPMMSETSAPAFKTITFSGAGGPGTLQLINGRSDDPSVPGIDRAQVKLNGQTVIDLGDLDEGITTLAESVTIADGENALDIISIGKTGSEFTIRVTQEVDAEAAFLIGPEGGTFEVTDPGAGSFGMTLTVGKNTFDKAMLIQINSVPHERATPLFDQYREPVSALTDLKPAGPTGGSIQVCFPINSQEEGTYALYILDDEGYQWVPSTDVLEEQADGKSVCGSLSLLAAYAVVNVSECAARGARAYSAKADPTCREKWENSLYFALLEGQLRLLANPIYSESITEIVSREDLNRTQTSVLSQARLLDGLNGKNLDQLWLNSEEETVKLAERFFGAEFTAIWFRTMYDAMTTPAEEQTLSFDIPEEDFQVLTTFLDSLTPEEKSRRANELLVANEFLYQYFHQGTDENLLREVLMLPPDSDMAEAMHVIANNLGLITDPPGIDYDIEGVSSTVSDSLSIIYRIARELTTPTVSTGTATDITISEAHIGGGVNPHGLDTEVWFEWGTDPDMAIFETTSPVSTGAKGEETSFNQQISGLRPLSTYYYRIAASNDTGAAKGTVSTFETPGFPPTVTHSSGEPVTASSVNLIGNVNPNMLPTEAWFEWGSDPSLPVFNKTATQAVGEGGTSQSFSSPLVDLPPASTYYFRVAASNGAGMTKGPVMAFTLPEIVVATRTASDVTTAAATISGNLFSDNLPASAWFEWGVDPTLSDATVTPPQSFEAGAGGEILEHSLEGLNPNSTYYYRLVASIGSETVAGNTLSFTTAPADTPASSTKLFWLPPTTRVDGSELEDLAGFKIYLGTFPSTYTSSIDVLYVTRYTLMNLPPGTWYFSVTAYDSQGNESAFSNELSKEIP